MTKETRFCPFKKEVTRTIRRGKSGEMEMGYYDKFKRCAGECCMAYDGGDCRKLPARDLHPLQKEARQ